MSYKSTLLAVNTVKALGILDLEITQQGGYVYFKCPECQGKAVAKAYGEKKNLTYCTQCKKAGHIISLTEKVKGINYDEAVDLLKKATATLKKPSELKVKYELTYHDFLEKMGITEETCKTYGVGVPKGRTMMSGCVAFTVFEDWNSIAYYGIRMKNLRPVFHHSFNPELFLYTTGIDGEETIFTLSMFDCLRNWQDKKKAVCNFGLPYISAPQAELLNQQGNIIFQVPEEMKKNFAVQAMESLKVYYHF